MNVFEAVKQDDVAYVKRLLDAKEAAVNALEPETEKSLLMIAAEHGHKTMVEMLLKEGADVGYADSQGGNVLYYGKNFKPEDAELVAIIQNAINDSLVEILQSSANSKAKVEWVTWWLDAGLDFNYKVPQKALRLGLPANIILRLLTQGDIVKSSEFGELFRTALRQYSSDDQVAIIELLIKKGMDLNSPINNGYGGQYKNALDFVMHNAGTLELYEILLKAGANPNQSNENCYMPLMTCANDLQIITLLLKHGADPLLDTVLNYSDYKKTNSLDYLFLAKIKNGYAYAYKAQLKIMLAAAVLKLYDSNDPLVMAVALVQLENIKMLTDISSLKLQDRSDEDCNTLEQSLEKALAADKFLQKYESNDPQITKCLTELHAALRERLSEKEAPKKGWFSWLGREEYKPLSSDAGVEEEPLRSLTDAKNNPLKPS